MDHKRPPLYTIKGIDFPAPHVVKLNNGMDVYLLEGGSLEVCKIDIMFLAGRPFEHKRLVASSLAGTIREGTLRNSASAIAEAVDHVGASIASPFSFDHIGLQLTCLTKHVNDLVPYLIDIIREPAFDDGELSLFKKRRIQRLAVDLSHNDVMAYRIATEQYFGADHPYGYNSNGNLYSDVSREDLHLHHKRYFSPANASVFIAGKVPDRLLQLLEGELNGWNQPVASLAVNLPTDLPSPTEIVDDMHKPQTSIRIGRRLFNRNDPDWPALFVLSTILGGYFGSRLMKNLREEQGLTYGVQSALESLKYDGYFSISLETDRKSVKKVLKGIDSEIQTLQQDLVPAEEMLMVKNYLAGYLLSLMDGPLQTLDVLKSNLAENSPYNFTEILLQKLADIDSIDIQRVAQKYLQKEDLSRVIIH